MFYNQLNDIGTHVQGKLYFVKKKFKSSLITPRIYSGHGAHSKGQRLEEEVLPLL